MGGSNQFRPLLEYGLQVVGERKLDDLLIGVLPTGELSILVNNQHRFTVGGYGLGRLLEALERVRQRAAVAAGAAGAAGGPAAG